MLSLDGLFCVGCLKDLRHGADLKEIQGRDCEECFKLSTQEPEIKITEVEKSYEH
jgi:hypothetical protein